MSAVASGWNVIVRKKTLEDSNLANHVGGACRVRVGHQMSNPWRLPGRLVYETDRLAEPRREEVPRWVDRATVRFQHRLANGRFRREADDREFPLLTDWSTEQLTAAGPAQMTPCCSSASISPADNPSQSP